MTSSAGIEGVVERHDPTLPRFVVVPAASIVPWELRGTTTVEGTLNGVPIGRRSLKRWDEQRWFLDLPAALCRRAGVETGDRVRLSLRPASTDLPQELERLLAESRAAAAAWRSMSASRRRVTREHVLAAKRPETRVRRARRALGLDR